MTDNNAKTTAADKVARDPIVIEKHSFNLPKSTSFTFDQLLCLNYAHTKTEIAIELLNDAADCYCYLPVLNELVEKIQPSLYRIAEEASGLNRELYNYMNHKEQDQ